MRPNVDDSQVKQVLDGSPEYQYHYFCEEVAAWETVWALELDEGWATSVDDDGRRQFPVWPHERYAQECVTGNWAHANVTGIEIESFFDLLDELEQKGDGVAVLQRPDGQHLPVEPSRLRGDLEDALEDFEPLENAAAREAGDDDAPSDPERRLRELALKGDRDAARKLSASRAEIGKDMEAEHWARVASGKDEPADAPQS